MYFDKYKVDLPSGSSGDWVVEPFEVSEQAASFEQLRAVTMGAGRGVPAGTYTALKHRDSLVMSDTPDEIRDHLGPIYQARATQCSHALINGLGLGMVAAAILEGAPACILTVIEASPDVVALIGPTLSERFGSRLQVIEADAFAYKPPKGQRYGVVWHDIWPNLCTDNLAEMATLHRRYGRRADWQGSWGKELLQHYRRQGR